MDVWYSIVMLNTGDHHNCKLFDPWEQLGEKRLKLLRKSWAEVFRKHVLASIPIEKVADRFHQTMGRPTKDIYIMVGALLLQQLHDLTDGEAVNALSFNVMWHYALDITDEDDMYICEKTLRNYRRRVIELGLDVEIFQRITENLIKNFKVNISKQRLDSTGLQSAMRQLTRLGTFVETIGKFLRELARKCETEYKRVDRELIRKYVEREGEGCFGSTKPSESKRRLPEAARDLFDLVMMFRGTDAASLESFKLLERVLSEQVDIGDDDDGGPKIRVKGPNEVSYDKVNNPSDPDSSFNTHYGQGYKTQVMESFTEDDDAVAPDMITHVEVTDMTEADCHAVEPALDKAEECDAKPDELLADISYGTRKNRDDASERGVEIVAPTHPPKGYKSGKFSLEHFDIDGKGLVVKCPAGKEPMSTRDGGNWLDARFNRKDCSECALAERCPCGMMVRKGKKPRLQYRRQRLERRERLLAEKSDEFRERYRWRSGIEATISRLKHLMSLAKLRVRGKPAVTYAVSMRALGLNIIRAAAFL